MDQCWQAYKASSLTTDVNPFLIDSSTWKRVYLQLGFRHYCIECTEIGMTSVGASLSIAGLVVFGTFTSLAAKIGTWIYFDYRTCRKLGHHRSHPSQNPSSQPSFSTLWHPCNAVYELESVGIDGKLKHFEKPWAMTTGTSQLSHLWKHFFQTAHSCIFKCIFIQLSILNITKSSQSCLWAWHSACH